MRTYSGASTIDFKHGWLNALKGPSSHLNGPSSDLSHRQLLSFLPHKAVWHRGLARWVALRHKGQSWVVRHDLGWEPAIKALPFTCLQPLTSALNGFYPTVQLARPDSATSLASSAPSQPPHPPSYMEVLEMLEKGITPPGIRVRSAACMHVCLPFYVF